MSDDSPKYEPLPGHVWRVRRFDGLPGFEHVVADVGGPEGERWVDTFALEARDGARADRNAPFRMPLADMMGEFDGQRWEHVGFELDRGAVVRVGDVRRDRPGVHVVDELRVVAVGVLDVVVQLPDGSRVNAMPAHVASWPLVSPLEPPEVVAPIIDLASCVAVQGCESVTLPMTTARPTRGFYDVLRRANGDDLEGARWSRVDVRDSSAAAIVVVENGERGLVSFTQWAAMVAAGEIRGPIVEDTTGAGEPGPKLASVIPIRRTADPKPDVKTGDVSETAGVVDLLKAMLVEAEAGRIAQVALVARTTKGDITVRCGVPADGIQVMGLFAFAMQTLGAVMNAATPSGSDEPPPRRRA